MFKLMGTREFDCESMNRVHRAFQVFILNAIRCWAPADEDSSTGID